MFYVESQSSRLTGWFPTKELAEQHCRDWPDEGMSVIPGCYIAGVVEKSPPRLMTDKMVKALGDYEWTQSHPGNFISKPRAEIDDVQSAWLDKVKEANRRCYDAMFVAAFKIAFEAGMKAGEWQPWETAPTDGTYFDAWVEPSKSGEKARRIPHVTFDHDGFWVGDEGYVYELGTPTHWRPEPEGPKK
jgi:hypothetical protein